MQNKNSCIHAVTEWFLARWKHVASVWKCVALWKGYFSACQIIAKFVADKMGSSQTFMVATVKLDVNCK